MQVLAASAQDLSELFRDPVLTVACVMLIVVSVGWIVITRLILRAMKKAALRGRPVPRIDVVRPPRDIWSYPPERPYDQEQRAAATHSI